mmetsp:Transcript_9988/g.22376  ORF Transcript_9988/g.22376 Transcript_9988/m.22376 type:complete len:204 (+) Transcript_9988:112-723(+)
MVLTEEQQKRMEESRKRALEIKRKKQIEKEKNEKMMASANAPSVFDAGGFVGKSSGMESQNNKRRINEVSVDVGGGGKKGCNVENASTKTISNGNSNNTNEDANDDDESSLEDFELNASAHISQTEARSIYCVPLGTLAVCSYIEKDNPRNRGFAKLKLYVRSEVRRRGRKRFGGKEGLIREREGRKKKRFEKDLAETKDVFG